MLGLPEEQIEITLLLRKFHDFEKADSRCQNLESVIVRLATLDLSPL